MKDLFNSINPKRVLSPSAGPTDNTAQVGQIIDRQGFESVTYVIATGSLADADATFTVLLEEGDQANMSDAATPAAADLLGTAALASFIFSDDDKVFKIGYIGSKRYTRLTITPANNASAGALCAVAILGHAAVKPTVNPPA
jgi:hypothetical protein